MRSSLVDLPLEQKAARAVTALMEAAEAVAEVAREGGFGAAPAVVQPALAMAVLRSADQAQAAAAAAVAAVDASGWLPDGHVSLGRWLEQVAGLHSPPGQRPARRGPGVLTEDYSRPGRTRWLTGDISGSMATTMRHRHRADPAPHPRASTDRAKRASHASTSSSPTPRRITPDRMAAS